MRKYLILLAATLCFGGLELFAQVERGSGTGPRNPANLTSFVEVFNGCETTIVSFNGVAQTRLITSGRGVLAGVEINSVTEGNAAKVPWRVSFYDAASLSDVTLASTSYGNSQKIVADQFGGSLSDFSPASVGGAFVDTSLGNVRHNSYHTPIKFKNGIVIENGSAANHGSMTIYYLR